MVQELELLLLLAEDPSPTSGLSQLPVTLVPEDLTPSSGYYGWAYTCVHAHAHARAHAHTQIFLKKTMKWGAGGEVEEEEAGKGMGCLGKGDGLSENTTPPLIINVKRERREGRGHTSDKTPNFRAGWMVSLSRRKTKQNKT